MTVYEYIQFSLLGIPAIVHCGNTLSEHPFGESGEDVWYTPMYFIKGFAFRKQKEYIDFRSVLKRMRKRKQRLLIS